MTAREKASELIVNYQLKCKSLDYQQAKECALIAVEEIMKAPHENRYIELIPSDADETDWFWDKFDEYWKEVKEEIQKL